MTAAVDILKRNKNVLISPQKSLHRTKASVLKFYKNKIHFIIKNKTFKICKLEINLNYFIVSMKLAG